MKKIGRTCVSPLIVRVFLLGSEADVCSDILDSFPPLPGMEGVELEMHEAPILLRYRSVSAKFRNGTVVTVLYLPTVLSYVPLPMKLLRKIPVYF